MARLTTTIKRLRPEDVWQPPIGAPKGNKNALKTGRYTTEKKALRRRIAALISGPISPWPRSTSACPGASLAEARDEDQGHRRETAANEMIICLSPQVENLGCGLCVTQAREIRHRLQKSLADQAVPLDPNGESHKLCMPSGGTGGPPSGGGQE